MEIQFDTNVFKAIICLAFVGGFGGLIRGISVLINQIKISNKVIFIDFFELLYGFLSGLAGGIVIFIVAPANNFEKFAQDIQVTIELFALSLIGGYSGTFILIKASNDKFIEKIGKFQEQQKEQEENNSTALRLVDIQLSKSNEPISEEKLKQTIKASSKETQEIIFNLARSNRKVFREQESKEFFQSACKTISDFKKAKIKNKIPDCIARTIPIFEALTESDYGKNNHRYYAQLGYALKDQNKPDWQKSLKALNEAIEKLEQDKNTNKNSPHYYFNKAICLLEIEKETNKKANKYEVKRAIEEGSKFPLLKNSIQTKTEKNDKIDDPDLFARWIKENNLKLEETPNGSLKLTLLRLDGSV